MLRALLLAQGRAKSNLVSAESKTESNAAGSVAFSFTGDQIAKSAKEKDAELAGESASKPGWIQMPPICPRLYSHALARKTIVENCELLMELQR